jgi:hypothetical protein
MGGLFSAPKPVVIAPPPAPDPAPAAEAAAAARDARVEAIERARRGLAGTVATSARGVLSAPPSLVRKSLLGE